MFPATEVLENWFLGSLGFADHIEERIEADSQ